MKKVASILLLALMLYNCFGYRVFIAYLEEKADIHLEAQLDNNNYDFTELVSLKIPVTNLPYYTNSNNFERINGRVEIKGIQYKFVKLRLYHDSLELLCIPDQAAMSLKSAKDNFFSVVNDLQHTGQNKKTGSHQDDSKNLSTDSYTVNDLFRINDPFSILVKKGAYVVDFKSSYFPSSIENPPEQI